MKDTIYIVFNEKNVIKMLKTEPDAKYFFRLDVIVEDEHFEKNVLQTTLKIDKDANLKLEEFELELKRNKKIE